MDAFRQFSKPSMFHRNANTKPFFHFRTHPKVGANSKSIRDEPQAMEVDGDVAEAEVEMNEIEAEEFKEPNARGTDESANRCMTPTHNEPHGKRRISNASEQNSDWSDDSVHLLPTGCIHMNLLTAVEEKAAQHIAAKQISDSFAVLTDEETAFIQKQELTCKKKAFPGKFALGFSSIFRKNNKGEMPTYVPPIAAVSKGIFGSKLKDIVENASDEWGPMKAKIPKICVHMARYLVQHRAADKEGIFRLGGAFHRIQSIVTDVIAGNYDDGFDSLDGKFIENGGCVSSVPSIPNMEAPIHEVASVLKKFLRELAEPIIPNRLHAAGRAIVNLHANQSCGGNVTPSLQVIEHVQKVILLLPSHTRSMLQFTLDLATWVARNQQCNQMTAENLGRVLGPNLITYTPVLQGGVRPSRTTGLDAFDWVNKFFEICVLANGECVPGKTPGEYPSATSPLFSLGEDMRKTIRQATMAVITTTVNLPRVDNNQGLLRRPATHFANVGFSVSTVPLPAPLPRPIQSQTAFFYNPDPSRAYSNLFQENGVNKKSRFLL